MKPVCVFYYGGWSTSIRDRIIATQPMYLILNESAGSYGGGPSDSDVAMVQASGIKVLAYIKTSGIRGFMWSPDDVSGSRQAVRGFIANVAAHGYAGVFFDEGGLYSPVPGQTYQDSILDANLKSPGGISGNAKYNYAQGQSWLGYTVRDYLDYARSLGLFICLGMDDNRTSKINSNIFPLIDALLTQEKYNGAAPAGVEIAFTGKCWVLSYAGSYSATNTNKALAYGFGAAYNCQSMGSLPSPAYENYMAAVTGGAPTPPPPNTYLLAVTVMGQGYTDPVTGTYDVPSGHTVTITAFPAAGWKFRSWSWPGNPDPAYSGWPENPTSWAMTGPVSIVAVFDSITSPPPPVAGAGPGIGALVLLTIVAIILSQGGQK